MLDQSDIDLIGAHVRTIVREELASRRARRPRDAAPEEWRRALRAYLVGRSEVTVHEVVAKALGDARARERGPEVLWAARALVAEGWARHRVRVARVRAYVYRRPAAPGPRELAGGGGASCCPFHASGGHPQDRHGMDAASVVYGGAGAAGGEEVGRG